MKATYTKPLLAVELFSFAQTTTRDCADYIPANKVNTADINSCEWDIGNGMTVFAAGTDCKLDGEQLGYACYNNPSEGNYMFRS